MSANVVSRIDEMSKVKKKWIWQFIGKRIDDIETSIQDLMNDLGVEENELQ